MFDESVIRAFAWNLLYAEALVADLDAPALTESGGPGLENHPAWTLGHLVTGANLVAEGLGLPGELPEGWEALFQRRGPGDPRLPESDSASYPGRDALLAELRRQHERIEDALRNADPSVFREEVDWAFGCDLPTLADSTVFLALTHEALHLGQIAAWRRARGLPSALLALAKERSADD
jgi:hypothetical protein